jgi:hypothetical protein
MGGKFGAWLWVVCFLANMYYAVSFFFEPHVFYLLNMAIVVWMVYSRFGNVENLWTWIRHSAKSELF